MKDWKLKNSVGKYFKLEVSKSSAHLSPDEYVPVNIDYPDAERYVLTSKETDEIYLIERIEDLNEVIKDLKKIHGIEDPWDVRPEEYKKKWSMKHASQKNIPLTEEEQKLIDKLVKFDKNNPALQLGRKSERG